MRESIPIINIFINEKSIIWREKEKGRGREGEIHHKIRSKETEVALVSRDKEVD